MREKLTWLDLWNLLTINTSLPPLHDLIISPNLNIPRLFPTHAMQTFFMTKVHP